MTPRLRLGISSLALAAACTWLYARDLSQAPIYVSPDEAIIAVDAHSLATTGRDVRGEFLPLYFKIQMPNEDRAGWFTPAIFYVSALFMKVLPFTESTTRLPTALVGTVNIFLTYLIARKLVATRSLAFVAAATLALAPAHFILSRYGLDYLYPLPFVLAWFWCLLLFIERESPAMLFIATVCLGVGVFSYISSVLMMPLYLLITLAWLSTRPRFVRRAGVAIAGFAVPVIPLAIWLFNHPTAVAETAARYDLYDSSSVSFLQGVRAYLSFPNLDRLASLYWSFFNPSFLFLSGDPHVMFSTRQAGVFTLAVAALLPIGAWHIIRRRLTAPYVMVLVCFFTAPLAAILVPEPAAITRAIAIMPFGALLAMFGVECLWRSRNRLVAAAAATASRPRPARWLAVGLLVLIPIQFGVFYRDYFTDYRLRSNPWLGGNLRGALELLIDRATLDRAPSVYFSRLRATSGQLDVRNRWMDAYWRFYLIKHGRQDLLEKTVHVDAIDVGSMREKSLMLANEGDLVTGALVDAGQLKQVALIPEIDREGFFVILQR